MKRLLSFILVAVVVVAAGVTPALAYDLPEIFDGCLFVDKFIERTGYLTSYNEEYYHYVDENDPESEIDWALVRAVADEIWNPSEMPTYNSYIVGDMVVTLNCEYEPFKTGYAVYDVSKGEFYDVIDIKLDKYPGLKEVLCTGRRGRIMGNVDKDDKVSVLDVTEIQRSLAQLCELNPDNIVRGSRNSKCVNIADYNLDGVISVLDATAIQLSLAGFDIDYRENQDLVITKVSDYNKMWDLGVMPEEAYDVEFQMEIDRQQFSGIMVNYEEVGEYYTVAIIKSNEQYNTLFNERAPQYSDEFFDDKWLVMAFTRCGCHESQAPVTQLGKIGSILYVKANEVVPDGPTSPTEPFWLSVVAVDKDELAYVNNVIKVK